MTKDQINLAVQITRMQIWNLAKSEPMAPRLITLMRELRVLRGERGGFDFGSAIDAELQRMMTEGVPYLRSDQPCPNCGSVKQTVTVTHVECAGCGATLRTLEAR